MKMFVLPFVLVGILSVMWAVLPGGEETFALSGCCKKNVGGQWQSIGTDFNACRAENQSDGDDIFKPKGNVWWDVSC